MTEDLLKDLDKRMLGAIDNFKTELQGLRTGRAAATRGLHHTYTTMYLCVTFA